jgi:hypothetical protein
MTPVASRDIQTGKNFFPAEAGNLDDFTISGKKNPMELYS